MGEEWQKGDASVRHGACQIFSTILKALDAREGCLIGRHGTIELTMCLQMWKQQSMDMIRAEILERNAGVFPLEETSLVDWFKGYFDASLSADVLGAAWYKPLAKSEWNMISELNPKCIKIPLRSIEPYYCKPVDHWTRILEGRNVTVVSSFTSTMQKQLEYKAQIWPSSYDSLLPMANWSFVRSYYAPVLAKGRAEWPSGIKSWSDAVTYMEAEVLKTKPEIVLIGCGGLGMILGHRLKKKGIVAVVLGGAIQVLFGIRGKRWENHPVISSFWNSDWLKPNVMEVPKGAEAVEGGCYW